MRALRGVVLACAVVVWCHPAFAQADTACGSGYRVIAHRWDAVLRMNWELRRDCAHPYWPARSVAIGTIPSGPMVLSGLVTPNESAPILQPLLVRAGDQVRLWMKEGPVRIEMSGVAEQSARSGEHVMVRITRQTDDAGLTVQRISGIARDAGDVEMER